MDSQQKHIGQNGVRFTTVAKARQVVARVRTAQAGIMGQLLQSAKLDRMAEQAALDGALAYSPMQFMGDLRTGVWVELTKPTTPISIYRRNLQRSYLNSMDTLLNGASSDEVRSIARGELRALDRQLQAALPGVTDEVTRRHVIDSRDEIATILDPLVPRPAARKGRPFEEQNRIRR